MPASVEWFATDDEGRRVGLLRVGSSHVSYLDADPYEAGCLVTDEGDTARLWFSHQQIHKQRQPIVRLLRDLGYRRMTWTRDAAHGLREIERML